MTSSGRRFWNLLSGVLIALFVAGFCTLVLSHTTPGSWRWQGPWEARELLFKGWVTTLEISVAALILSLGIGLLLMLGQRSPLGVVRWTCRLFLEFVRETPLLVQLLVGYFLIFAPLLSRPLDSIGWDEKLIIGILLLSLFEGAYLGEIFRGGVESIPRAQWESARAVGFNRRQVYRYVIFPQALRRVLPAVAGQFVSLIKDSSLLNVIGTAEFFYQTRVYTSKSYAGLEGYVPLALGYLVLTAPIAILSHFLERRFRDET